MFDGGILVVDQGTVHLHLLRIHHFNQAGGRLLAAAHLVQLRRNGLQAGVNIVKPGTAGGALTQINTQHHFHRPWWHPKIAGHRLPAAGAQQPLRIAARQKTPLVVIAFDKHAGALIFALAPEIFTANPGTKSQLLTRFDRQGLQHVVVVGRVVILIKQAALTAVATRDHLRRGQRPPGTTLLEAGILEQVAVAAGRIGQPRPAGARQQAGRG